MKTHIRKDKRERLKKITQEAEEAARSQHMKTLYGIASPFLSGLYQSIITEQSLAKVELVSLNYIAFLDFVKAFDGFNYDTLWNIPRHYRIKKKSPPPYRHSTTNGQG